jgi:hypothetical protein
VTDHQDVRRGHPRGDAAFLRPGDQMIDEHPQPAAGLGREVGHDLRQVVNAAEVLHDDADVPQVIAPDLLHQLGVVPPLDEDPARAGHPGAARRGRDRTGRGPHGPATARPGRSRPRQHDPAALQQERTAEREHAALAEAVLQHHRVLLATDNGAAEFA